MKKYSVYFTIAFLLGFVGLGIIKHQTSHESTSAVATSTRSNTSKHVDDSFNEYEILMLDDEEKTTILIEQANDLNSLLGVAEKIWSKQGDWYRRLPDDLTKKIATMYPAQALQYYATIPSDVTMNHLMYEGIMREWINLDFSACLDFLDHDESLPLNKFCQTWTEFARDNLPEKSAECAQAFAKLSREKQQALMEEYTNNDKVALALLPVLDDPAMRAIATEIIDKENVSAASQNEPNPETKKAEEQMTALVEQCKTNKPDSQQLTDMLAEIKEESDRRKILDAVIEPSEEEEKDTPQWLARLAAILANVHELPPYPPNSNNYKNEFEQWLPSQSPRLQRAWADNLINQQSPEEAFSWIEKLSTASLRSDMREHAIRSWTKRDPQEAAQYINTKSSAEEQELLLPGAVYTWALNDFASATKWLETQADSPAKTAALKKLEK